MSLIIADINIPYDLYRRWIDGIQKYIQNTIIDSDIIYLIFVDSEDTFIYFPTLIHPNAIYVLPHGVLSTITPVFCSHCDDLSQVTFEQLTKMDSLSFSQYTLDEISLQDIIDSNIQLVTTETIKDFDIKCLFYFLSHANKDFENSTLVSYIKYSLIEKGETFVLSNGPIAQNHTRLELGSELIRCNSDLYQEYKNIKVQQILESIIDDTTCKPELEHKICNLIYEILCDHVVNCLGELWCFKESIWKVYSPDGYLWNFLTKNLIEYLQAHDAEKIALYIMSITTRSRLLKDVKFRLEDDSFYTKLDSKKNIINMLNGVYNTDTETLLPPVPSDYISITTGVPYQVYDEDSAKIQLLLDILHSIFPEPDLVDFFLTSCSTFLEGYNTPKLFFIWWGKGNNAKSLVQTLVMKTFGEYCSTAPTSLVTGKRGEASGATPELCHVEKKLIVFLQEPNPEERIKAGKMKEMTGNDTMYVRQLFKAGKTMTIKSKFVIVCNNIIEIPGMDAAIRRRLVVLPFLSTFLDPQEYYEKEQKGTLAKYSQIINPTIEKNLLSCTSAFMYLLCRKYSSYKDAAMSLTLPPIIKQHTNYYITQNNYPLKFISMFIHRVSNNQVEITEVYELYKDWYRKSYPGKKVQDYEFFVKELNDEGYKENQHGYIPNTYVSYTGEIKQMNF